MALLPTDKQAKTFLTQATEMSYKTRLIHTSIKHSHLISPAHRESRGRRKIADFGTPEVTDINYYNVLDHQPDTSLDLFGLLMSSSINAYAFDSQASRSGYPFQCYAKEGSACPIRATFSGVAAPLSFPRLRGALSFRISPSARHARRQRSKNIANPKPFANQKRC